MKKETTPYPKIGTMVYTVNKGAQLHKLLTKKVIPARIVGYQSIDGKVSPTLKQIGGKEINPEGYLIFYELEKAINAIT